MNNPTHIIDPDGDIIIVLRTANVSIADEEAETNGEVDPPPPPPEPVEDAVPERPASPVQEIESVQSYSKKSRKKKKKGNIYTSSYTFAEPAPESALEEPIPEPAVDDIEQAPVPVPETPEEDATESGDAPAPEPIEEDLEEGTSGTTYRIQASGKHLALASPVFKQQVLRAERRKGIANLHEEPAEIYAKDWHLEAFLVVLGVIHCQNSGLPRTLSLEKLAHVATIAHHYQCRDAIGILQDIWIKALPSPDTTLFSPDLVLWLWVSFFFELDDILSKVSSAVMSLGIGPINNLDLPFPHQLLENMDYRRQYAIKKVFLLLEQTQDSLLKTDRECSFECSSIMYGALMKELYRMNLPLSPMRDAPFPGLSYAQLVHKVSSIRSPTWFSRTRDTYRYERDSRQHDCGGSSFEQLFGHLDVRVPGLDLQTCTLDY